ncbi:hypothetical protein BS78_05G095200 [Paspalum vaginatum]|nr:hypothetical protein BS78_05G095200 [Paspalum vaginatum]
MPPSCQACGATETPPGPGVEDGRRPDKEAFDELQKRVSERMAKFICRAGLLLLWLYLYHSMTTYVTSSIDQDTWFRKFVVITLAVPMADVFIILGGLLLD